MKKKRVAKVAQIVPQMPSWRLLTLLVVLTGFLFQSYAVQTHVHFANESGLSTVAASIGDTSYGQKATTSKPAKQQHKKLPIDDPANCPLCQASFLAGQYVMPDAVVFVLPAQALAIVPAMLVLAVRSAFASHIWQGRAPPRI